MVSRPSFLSLMTRICADDVKFVLEYDGECFICVLLVVVLIAKSDVWVLQCSVVPHVCCLQHHKNTLYFLSNISIAFILLIPSDIASRCLLSGAQNPYGPNYREVHGVLNVVDFLLAVINSVSEYVLLDLVLFCE